MDNLEINTSLARSILTGFIRSETQRAGFNKVVLGLSGGIDSALSCYLSAKALGGENVLAVRMPYKTSSQESLDHAQLVIDAACVQSLTIPVTDMADGLISRWSDISSLRKGNIMARCRMIVLFDQSVVFNGLVVGTGNKTEILLGYTTLFGDSACAFNPLGDLYKTQVRQLARDMGIPEVIIG
ncbi:MAG: NAD(+) synthase, partial [Kiritimatiellota bacterium]|nr:NAD(+) synthase [Kiritimatiellota bacterium]